MSQQSGWSARCYTIAAKETQKLRPKALTGLSIYPGWQDHEEQRKRAEHFTYVVLLCSDKSSGCERRRKDKDRTFTNDNWGIITKTRITYENVIGRIEELRTGKAHATTSPRIPRGVARWSESMS